MNENIHFMDIFIQIAIIWLFWRPPVGAGPKANEKNALIEKKRRVWPKI